MGKNKAELRTHLVRQGDWFRQKLSGQRLEEYKGVCPVNSGGRIAWGKGSSHVKFRRQKGAWNVQRVE